MSVKISFVAPWADSSKLLTNMAKFSPNNSGTWKNIVGVSDPKDADVLVYLDNYKTYDTSKRMILFQSEPFNNPNISENAYGFDNHFFVVRYPHFIKCTYDFMYSLYPPTKTKTLSTITSAKSFFPGHAHRKSFIINLSNRLEIDIFGYGWGNELGDNYKGPLDGYHNYNVDNPRTKYDSLINYKYSICIENCSRDNYFTEKFTDAILCWTIPIYYGCKNISKYFPEGCYYYIDIYDPKCHEKINEIINRPITQYNIECIKEARELILNKYNIWNQINEILS